MIGETYEDEENEVLLFRGTFQDVAEQQLFIKKIEDKNAALRDSMDPIASVRGPLTSILGLINLLNEHNEQITENKLAAKTLEMLEWLRESVQLDSVIKDVMEKSNSTEETTI